MSARGSARVHHGRTAYGGTYVTTDAPTALGAYARQVVHLQPVSLWTLAADQRAHITSTNNAIERGYRRTWAVLSLPAVALLYLAAWMLTDPRRAAGALGLTAAAVLLHLLGGGR
jgi:hypothetical protein